jgi:hypothetical protein
MAKYAPCQTVSVGLLFVSVQSKHRNSLFRYRSETNETNVLCFVSDSAETSFGSSFGCFESKLVSKDTLFTVQLMAGYARRHTASLWRRVVCVNTASPSIYGAVAEIPAGIFIQPRPQHGYYRPGDYA